MKIFTILSSLPILIAFVSVVAANSMATPDTQAGIRTPDPVVLQAPSSAPAAPAAASLVAWELRAPEQTQTLRLTD